MTLMRLVLIGLLLSTGVLAQEAAKPAPAPAKPASPTLVQARKVLQNSQDALSKTPEYRAYVDALELVRGLEAAEKPGK